MGQCSYLIPRFDYSTIILRSTNEEVLVLLPTSSNKLLAQWQGPYHVLRRLGKVNYKVYMPDKRKRRSVFQINMLNKWHPPEATCFWTADNTDPEEEEEEVVPSWQGENNLVPAIGAKLTELQKAQLIELLSDYRTVMSGYCGRTSACQHHIRTKEGLL